MFDKSSGSEKINDGAKDLQLEVPRTWADPNSHFDEAILSDWYRLLFKMYAQIVQSTNEFFALKKLSPILMPITCGSVSSPMGFGSDSLPVQVELFNENTYLADSMQFQLEYMLRHDGKGVYYIMPTFRGESHTTRHLNQFFHSEAEIRGDLSMAMSLVEDYVKFLSEAMLSRTGIELEKFGIGTDHIEQMIKVCGKIPRISYREAKRILGDDKVYWGALPGNCETISCEGEKALMERLGGIVWLTHFPTNSVPFYQASSDCSEFALCGDLLFGIGEVVGCGERHSTGAQALKALERHKVDPKQYGWYIKMKDRYPMKTSGFGLGIERYLLWVLKHNDIRDLHIMPRLKGIAYGF